MVLMANSTPLFYLGPAGSWDRLSLPPSLSLYLLASPSLFVALGCFPGGLKGWQGWSIYYYLFYF